jgi:uncharacterized Fe-S center protein
MVSEVYFADIKGKRKSLITKLQDLFDQAGFPDLIKKKDLVALKLHFGEKGNTAFISPLFVRAVADRVKACGAKPFLTDCNTLYAGNRSNAVDHTITAVENGFDYAVVGAPIVIADGMNGKEYLTVEINGKHFDEVKIGAAAGHADAIISLAHFKGHELTGFGGTLKNLGMGLGSRGGKQMMHSDVLPVVYQNKCTGCADCLKWCPTKAITFSQKKAQIDQERCYGCGECVATCTSGAIEINWKTEPKITQEKTVEYAKGALTGKEKKSGFINFLMNITPDCDCYGWNDSAIVPDIGILASRDAIAIDKASVDLVNKTQGLKGSRLRDINSRDKFRAVTEIDWMPQLRHGEEIGLGTMEYKLIEVT